MSSFSFSSSSSSIFASSFGDLLSLGFVRFAPLSAFTSNLSRRRAGQPWAILEEGKNEALVLLSHRKASHLYCLPEDNTDGIFEANNACLSACLPLSSSFSLSQVGFRYFLISFVLINKLLPNHDYLYFFTWEGPCKWNTIPIHVHERCTLDTIWEKLRLSINTVFGG